MIQEAVWNDFLLHIVTYLYVGTEEGSRGERQRASPQHRLSEDSLLFSSPFPLCTYQGWSSVQFLASSRPPSRVARNCLYPQLPGIGAIFWSPRDTHKHYTHSQTHIHINKINIWFKKTKRTFLFSVDLALPVSWTRPEAVPCQSTVLSPYLHPSCWPRSPTRNDRRQVQYWKWWW